MGLSKINPTKTKAWKDLLKHYISVKNLKMTSLFEKEPLRAENLTIKWDDFLVDYSKNRITQETLELLQNLAKEVNLKEAIKAQFQGDIINETEERSVLHTALRTPISDKIFVDGKNIVPEIHDVKSKIETFTNQIVSGERKGYTNKSFTDIVNIGIGGSDLGPAMVVESLQYYKNHLNTHFVSNVDGDHVNEVIKKLNPETTLFIIVSKTFTSQETLTNANTLRDWFLTHATQKEVSKHFVAVSTNKEKAEEFGIDTNSIFPMWNWVGGRFSLWSSVGLIISLAIGYKNFDLLLKGANKMDNHFKSTDLDQNIPVVLALLSVWYNNFFNAESEAVIPYSQYLNQFATYLQQGVMESNGKSVDRNGDKIGYQTGTLILGEPGTNSQHAFFQLIHQGTKLVPVDFIGFAKSLHGNQEHQDKLISNFIAQTEALYKGKTKEKVLTELETLNRPQEVKEKLKFFKFFEGNKPTNSIFINKLTPESLGKLIAMYEHKIFVQGVIWNIFSYDQFGVELGKELASTILKDLENENLEDHDASTQQLIKHFKQFR
ncbi:glucose-6-phosphate isomerase [Aurantibacter sp.]|uniref:glucose-6-phosphate isomerase n=1 Tax=Aurantibacter sp. TaxID=2807103 RepID=UPI0035C7F436